MSNQAKFDRIHDVANWIVNSLADNILDKPVRMPNGKDTTLRTKIAWLNEEQRQDKALHHQNGQKLDEINSKLDRLLADHEEPEPATDPAPTEGGQTDGGTSTGPVTSTR